MQVIEDLHLSTTHAIFTCICQRLVERKENCLPAYSQPVPFAEPLEQGVGINRFVNVATKSPR
jgi:hypothetical protein